MRGEASVNTYDSLATALLIKVNLVIKEDYKGKVQHFWNQPSQRVNTNLFFKVRY